MKNLIFLFFIGFYTNTLLALTDEEVESYIQRIEESQKRLYKSLDTLEETIKKAKEVQEKRTRAFEEVHKTFEFKSCVGEFDGMVIYGAEEEEVEAFLQKCVKPENIPTFQKKMAALMDTLFED